jgi:peptide/nickel transport system permease protein
MFSFVTRRVLGAIPLVLGIATIIFFVVNLAPGDPTALYANQNVPPEVLAQIRANFGLDQPLHPLLEVAGGVLHGRLRLLLRPQPARPRHHHGDAAGHADPGRLHAGPDLPDRVTTGIFQAVRQHRAADRVLSILSLFFYSMPSFWLGLMLMLLFSLKAHEWGLPFALPPTGMTSVDYEYLGFGEQVQDRLVHLVLPVLTLTLVMAAGIARYTRGQMLEVIRQDYIRTARAKGLPERTVILKHALRNSLLPVITLLGLYLPLLFSGSVFVEVIFSWPGMGRVIVDAIFQRDYPVVMATSFIFALVVVLGSLIADILYAVADPRIRYD